MIESRAQQAMEAVALRNGVSVEEVHREIQTAIKAARESSKSNPIAQAHWNNMSRSNEEVSPEDLITYIAAQIIK